MSAISHFCLVLAPLPKFEMEPVDQNFENSSSGEHILIWLKDVILNRKLIMNDAKAFVHTFNKTIFIAILGIFMRYALEFHSVQSLTKKEGVQNWL